MKEVYGCDQKILRDLNIVQLFFTIENVYVYVVFSNY